jgi:type VI protein secretion system component VasF
VNGAVWAVIAGCAAAVITIFLIWRWTMNRAMDELHDTVEKASS